MILNSFIFLLFVEFISCETLFGYSGTSTCPYPRLDHGRPRVRQRSRLVKFVCSPRYELVGNKYATCRNGQWDVPLPVCVRPGCPPLPENENLMPISSRSGAWVVFFCMPRHKLVGSPALYCNGRKWNGTAPTCTDTTFPPELNCDFEDADLCGWTQDELHDFDWRRLNKKTPSSFLFTGPSFDHTYGNGPPFGHYMYIESTSRIENDTARLISPIYDVSLTKDGCFSFFYHMYGQGTGTLRVYQKPDSLQLQNMLYLKDVDKKKYILFEKKGDLGDFWYNDVPKLHNFNEDFQIVVEGVRGPSFTSDIAIDDVAILQGQECETAKMAASTPATVIISRESCTGRCNVAESGVNMCGCTSACYLNRDCCEDYLDICVFNSDSTTDTSVSYSTDQTEPAPQTLKLVATTTEVTPKEVPLPPTNITNSTTKTTTTTKPTTTTTPKFNITTTKLITKAKMITAKKPSLVFKSTTPVYNATGILKKDTIKQITKLTISTQKSVITAKVTTVIPAVNITTSSKYSRINLTTYRNDKLSKADRERLIQAKRELIRKKLEQKSNAKTESIIIVVLILSAACGAWTIYLLKTTRGRAVLSRIRGRTTRDPEVRYLTSHVDED